MRMGPPQVRRLGRLELTYHALDSYVNRVPGSEYHRAAEDIAALEPDAQYVRTRPTGEEIWRAPCRGGLLTLVVHRIARRPPILLTTIYDETA